MQSSSRNIGLDILRAAAILGVFFCHGITITIKDRDILGPFGSGVELFFVLSGFLIGRIYFRSSQGESFSFWNFWRSRWWRTLPPYYAAILVYLIVRLMAPAPGLHWYYALFLQNYLGVTGFGPSWSLCVEEHFYLLLPVAGVVIDRTLGRRSWRYLLPAAILLPLAFRLLTPAFLKPLPAQWFWFTHLHCDGLIVGVYLAYLFVEQHEVFSALKAPLKFLLPLAPLTMLTGIVWQHRPESINALQNTMYALGYGAWLRYSYDLRWIPVQPMGRLFRWAFQGVALCSYSVYLTHTIFDPAIRNHVLGEMHRGLAKSAIVLTATFLGGVIFYFLVERPTIRTRDHYLKRNRRTLPEGSPMVKLSDEMA